MAASWFASVAEADGRVRGEFTLVLGPMEATAVRLRDEEDKDAKAQHVSELLRADLQAGASVSRAAKAVSAAVGVSKAKVYAEALRLKAELALDAPATSTPDGHGG